MSDINSVDIIGRLTRDSELTYTQSGYPICKFSIAVNRDKKQGEEWVKEVSYFNITLWGKRGESLGHYLLKGKQVGISGELRQDRWENKEGEKRSKVYIDAKNIQLVGGREDSTGVREAPRIPSFDPAARKPGDPPGRFVAAVHGEEPVF